MDGRKRSNMKYILTVIYILLTTGGIFCLKSGGNTLSFGIKGGFSFHIGYVTLLGFLLYLCSFLLWQKLLTTFDLNYIVPITAGIVQIVVLLLGAFFFKENINFVNVLGTFLVIAGVILISFKR